MANKGFWAGSIGIFPSRTRRGYAWKLCPYSSDYRARFYDLGFVGNTTNPEINENTFNSITTADHPDTEGGMNYKNNGGAPGWICWDNACPYFLTEGVRYFEL